MLSLLFITRTFSSEEKFRYDSHDFCSFSKRNTEKKLFCGNIRKCIGIFQFFLENHLITWKCILSLVIEIKPLCRTSGWIHKKSMKKQVIINFSYTRLLYIHLSFCAHLFAFISVYMSLNIPIWILAWKILRVIFRRRYFLVNWNQWRVIIVFPLLSHLGW